MQFETVTMQEVRKDPLGFLERIKAGKTLTVIYHSKPFTTVTCAEKSSPNTRRSAMNLLKKAEVARSNAQPVSDLDDSPDYKQIYSDDMAQKYDIS